MTFGTSIQGAFGALSTSAKETPVPRSSFLPTSQSWSSPFSAATETYRKNMSSYLGSPGSGSRPTPPPPPPPQAPPPRPPPAPPHPPSRPPRAPPGPPRTCACPVRRAAEPQRVIAACLYSTSGSPLSEATCSSAFATRPAWLTTAASASTWTCERFQGWARGWERFVSASERKGSAGERSREAEPLSSGERRARDPRIGARVSTGGTGRAGGDRSRLAPRTRASTRRAGCRFETRARFEATHLLFLRLHRGPLGQLHSALL